MDPSGRGNHARGRILIVEDEGQVGQMIAQWLREDGHECKCVCTAKEAGVAMATSAYDLIITDIHLPDRETLAWLGTCQGGSAPPYVIVMTGYPSIETAVDAVRHSVVEYLVKPVEEEGLRASVRRVIGQGLVLRTLRKAHEEVRLWGEAMTILEQFLSASGGLGGKARGAELMKQVQGQTILLFRQMVVSLKAIIEATKSGRSDDRKMSLCAAVGCTKPAVYEEALRQSVEVLANTKHAFKSKELGDLRKMLAGILKEERPL